MKSVQWTLLVMLFSAFGSCNVNDVDGSTLTVSFVIPTTEMPAPEHQLRYAVVWMGRSVWRVTDDGAIADGTTVVRIPIELPPPDVLEHVEPAESLTYAYYYLPEVPMRRPRIVIYDDVNRNGQFELAKDRVLALDGFQLDYYATILAFVNLDEFLSLLDLEQTQIYYGWTFGEYSNLMFGTADPDWSSYVIPLFEDAYHAESQYPQPTLELQTGNEMLMEKDLLCFRNITKSYESTYEQIWVDNTLNVDAICRDTAIPCAGFDASIAPDFESMAKEGDVFTRSCGWNNSIYQPMGASISTVTCDGCNCTYHSRVITYYLNISSQPEWSPCTESITLNTTF